MKSPEAPKDWLAQARSVLDSEVEAQDYALRSRLTAIRRKTKKGKKYPVRYRRNRYNRKKSDQRRTRDLIKLVVKEMGVDVVVTIIFLIIL